MDEVVIRSLAKWPNVPAVFGWLGLDRRGNWSIKGERIANPLMIGFIGRNYAADLEGRWFFQNGPQRVYVTLEYTPYIYSAEVVRKMPVLTTHTEVTATQVREVMLDDRGGIVVRTELGVGEVRGADLAAIVASLVGTTGEPLEDADVERLLAGDHEKRVFLDYANRRVPIGTARAADLAKRFAFDPDPHPPDGAPDC